MAYTRFEDMDLEGQVALLHKAVSQLQSRFNSHVHNPNNGDVMVDPHYDEIDVDGVSN